MLENLSSNVATVTEIIDNYCNNVIKKSKNYKFLQQNRETLREDEKNYEKVYFQYKNNQSELEQKKYNHSNDYKDRMESAYNAVYRDLKKRVIKENYCAICGTELIFPEMDHVLPKAKFPQYYISPINLVPICSQCNSKKEKSAKNENFAIYNSRLENTNLLRDKLLKGYTIKNSENALTIENKKKFSMSEENIIKSYGLDIRIKLTFGKVINNIINQLEFIFNNQRENKPLYVSSNTIRVLLEKLDYNNTGVDDVTIKTLKNNLDLFETYVQKRLGERYPIHNYSFIEKELCDLEKEEHLEKNKHITNIRRYLSK